MNLKELQDFIKALAKSGVSELELETADLKLKMTTSIKEEARQAETVVQHVAYPQAFAGMTQVPLPQVPQTTVPPATVSQTVAETTKTETPKETENPNKYVTIKAPMVGTFYRKPSPEKPPFVQVGETFKTGDVICIIEAMKLFNEIEAEISGKIVKVLAEDMSPVEFDQPLFLVEP